MKYLLVPILLSISTLGHAEYRVYQYTLKNKIITSEDQANGKIIESTLDPIGYLAYHGGSTMISIDLLRTWICPGVTAKKDICDSPYAELSKEVLL